MQAKGGTTMPLLEGMLFEGFKGVGLGMLKATAGFALIGGGAIAVERTIHANNQRFNRIFHNNLNDRYTHLHVVGKSGYGKTTLLKKLIKSDMEAGHNVAWIEIKEQDECHQVLGLVPRERMDDVVYFSPYETDVGFNVLHVKDFNDEDEYEFIVDTVVSAFQQAYDDAWGIQTEMCLELGTRAILQLSRIKRKQHTLEDVYKILTEAEYMSAVHTILEQAGDVHHSLLSFLEDKGGYAKVPPQSKNSVQSKLRRFITHPRVRRTLCNTDNSLNFDKIVRKGILICDFHKGGSLGRVYSTIMASFVASNLQLATFRKTKREATPTFFYFDEFQDYVNPTFEEALSQFRSFKTGVIMSHQYMTQLTPSVQAAIDGCVASFVHFRCGDKDLTAVCKRLGLEDQQDRVIKMPKLRAAARIVRKGKLPDTSFVRVPFSKIDWITSKELRDRHQVRGDNDHAKTRFGNAVIDNEFEESQRPSTGETELPRDEVGRENDTVQPTETGAESSNLLPVLREDNIGDEVLQFDKRRSEGM
jgi:hypothetical protein